MIRGYLPGRLREAGIIARADDRGDSVLQIAPPLISDRALLDEIVDRLSEVLTDAGTHMGLSDAVAAAHLPPSPQPIAEPLWADPPRVGGRPANAARVQQVVPGSGTSPSTR